MTQTVLSGTLTGVLVLVAGTLIARFSLRTKAQESIEEIERRVAALAPQWYRGKVTPRWARVVRAS